MHVVALSGGKDSTAMALRLAEVEPRDYTYICTPTGDENAETFAHWRRLAERLGSPLIPVTARTTLDGLIRQQKMLPNHRARWCTRMLKIEPAAAWLALNVPCVYYVGLRADEPEREGGDYAAVAGVEQRFPMRDWGWALNDVLDYLRAKNVSIPKRTDCRKCFFQRLSEWFDFYKDDPKGWAEAEELETLTGHTFRSPGRDSWPAALKDLRAMFDKGGVPRGNQGDLFKGLQCRVCRI